MTLLIISLVLLVFGLTLGYGVRIIAEAETMVIERLGKFNRALNPGIRFIFPFLERPRRIMTIDYITDQDGKKVRDVQWNTRFDLRNRTQDFDEQNAITKDNVVINIDALLMYEIVDPQRAVYSVIDLPIAIEGLTKTTLRNIIGELTLDDTFASRDTINQQIRAELESATERWGIKINFVELQTITPPEHIRDAMEKEMRAEREKRATVTEAESIKKSTILEAEGRSQARILDADSEKRAKMLIADGDAGARLKEAQAEALAIEKIKDHTKNSSVSAEQYLLAMRYIESLKEMVSGKDNKVVYLPVEATGILGSLGGIKEIFDDLNPTKPDNRGEHHGGVRHKNQGLAGDGTTA